MELHELESNTYDSQVQPYNITFVKFQIFYMCINALASSSKPKKCICILNIFDSIKRKLLVFTMHLSIKLSYFFLDRQNIFKFSIFHEIDDFRINKTIRKISKDLERFRKIVKYEFLRNLAQITMVLSTYHWKN